MQDLLQDFLLQFSTHFNGGVESIKDFRNYMHFYTYVAFFGVRGAVFKKHPFLGIFRGAVLGVRFSRSLGGQKRYLCKTFD